ncbi:hypothetical protein DTO217A2_5564 [Paecilomyces variotii]|nr:hypothetical protein DTO217A2_5564 [Paecilomyces variotii]
MSARSYLSSALSSSLRPRCQSGQKVNCDLRILSSFSPNHPAIFTSWKSIPTRNYASPANEKRSVRASSQPVQKSDPTTTSTTTTTTPPSSTSEVNAPLSTLPVKLDVPAPAASDATPIDQFKRYIALGRAYYSFYKTGLKNVYHNYKASIPLRRSLGLPTYLPTSYPPATQTSSSQDDKTPSFFSAARGLGFTRADIQLVRRAAYDVRRMIPFTLILLICGETTPFIVLALGNAVTPATCRVPRQVEKEREAKLKRKNAAIAAHQAAVQGSMAPVAVGSKEELAILVDQYADVGFANTASAEEVLRACAVFGLAKTHTRPSALVPVVYRPRLRRWAQYLELDDRLIKQGGGVKAMSADEVRIAVEERGGVGAGGDGRNDWKAEMEERKWLEKWFERRRVD